jgi:hypothetical protein
MVKDTKMIFGAEGLFLVLVALQMFIMSGQM